MTAAPLPAPLRALRRRQGVLVVVAVLVLHTWLLTGLPLGAGSGLQGGVRALEVRSVAVAAPERPPPTLAEAPPPAAVGARDRRPRSAPAVTPTVTPPPALAAELAAAAAVEPAPQWLPASAAASAASKQLEGAATQVAFAAPDAVVAVTAVAAVATVAAVAAQGAGGDAPVYATRLPPATSLRYELRRGVLSGSGELHWLPGPDGYELTIDGLVLGIPVLAWISRGGYDEAGLAPLRFVDRRRARALRAANFRRDSARITYSGTTIEHPLARGGQDRLSWLVQLAAIVEADPARFVPGEQVSMQVSGARGDAEIWNLAVVAREAVELSGGRAAGTLLFRRNPRHSFDTQAEVWLDPARHHLPVRLRLTTLPDGETLEFTLRVTP